jgi:hypothetical protein
MNAQAFALLGARPAFDALPAIAARSFAGIQARLTSPDTVHRVRPVACPVPSVDRHVESL